mmetsp:Transcript_56409/g.156141  ORF Transcript_56409/g.156141 Transcript_56409/m.156141 type:complete len:316 (+) Transcript_56409:2629-3576(+)
MISLRAGSSRGYCRLVVLIPLSVNLVDGLTKGHLLVVRCARGSHIRRRTRYRALVLLRRVRRLFLLLSGLATSAVEVSLGPGVCARRRPFGHFVPRWCRLVRTVQVVLVDCAFQQILLLLRPGLFAIMVGALPMLPVLPVLAGLLVLLVLAVLLGFAVLAVLAVLLGRRLGTLPLFVALLPVFVPVAVAIPVAVAVVAVAVPVAIAVPVAVAVAVPVAVPLFVLATAAVLRLASAAWVLFPALFFGSGLTYRAITVAVAVAVTLALALGLAARLAVVLGTAVVARALAAVAVVAVLAAAAMMPLPGPTGALFRWP